MAVRRLGEDGAQPVAHEGVEMDLGDGGDDFVA